jgi:hypothetical protein
VPLFFFRFTEQEDWRVSGEQLEEEMDGTGGPASRTAQKLSS